MSQAVLRRGSRVLDISEHNGSVDFKAVRAAGIDGIIARAAYIGPGNVQKRDSMFTTQRVMEIRDAGLVMGVYMYTVGLHGRHGWDDFQFLYKTLHDVSRGLRGGIDMKLIADLEESELDGKGNSRWLTEFDAESRHHGYGTIGYAAISAIPFTEKVNIPCWVGNPNLAPGHPNGKPGFASSIAIHQYTFSARVNGVDGPVDESVIMDPAHLIIPAASKPRPVPAPAPRPKPAPKPKGRTAADVQQAMWLFLHNRGYKVSTDGGGGLAVDDHWGKQSSLAKLECQWRLGYSQVQLGRKVDDDFMFGLAHPKRFWARFPARAAAAAKRKTQHHYFDKVMPFKNGIGNWDGHTASQFIVEANTRVEKLTGVHAQGSDPTYAFLRTDSMQGRLRAQYVNSGYNPAYIAAPVGASRHQRHSKTEGAEDLFNISEFDAACRRSSTRPPYRYNYDGSGDIVHASDNAH